MLVQIVRFKSGLPEDEVMKVAMDRVYAYRAVPGLLEKYYTRTGDPDCYAGIMIWDSPEALAAFRQTELAATIGEVYGVIDGPKVEVFPAFFQLRADTAPKSVAVA